MNELIKITEKNGQKLVDARELHEFLQSKKDFSDWLKARIEKYSFLDGEDFTTFEGKSTGGRPSKEYTLTLDMAKELAMVEANEKGQQARRYFIACEKKLREIATAPQPSATPWHIRRYNENRRKVPVGYFSMLAEVVAVFFEPMELAGAPTEAMDRIMPDISMGRMFCGFLREHGHNPDDLPTYPYKTPSGITVSAKLYPEDLLPTFRRFVRSVWIPQRSPSYLSMKAPELLPYMPPLLSC
jgi:phage anti-repressor protein